jgi:hypothetical protein
VRLFSPIVADLLLLDFPFASGHNHSTPPLIAGVTFPSLLVFLTASIEGSVGVVSPNSTGHAPLYESAYDAAFPAVTIPWFGNDLVDDCVIVARAHHTIRLDYAAGKAVPAISEVDVTSEYHNECQVSGTNSLNLGTSLARWRDDGWTAGGAGPRKISQIYGPYTPIVPRGNADYPDAQMDPEQVQAAIYQYSGAHAQLLLPGSIDTNLPWTFGDQVLWSDTSDAPARAHTMLLIGYDENGPIGLTWGTRQRMTWNFLVRYCSIVPMTGLFFITPDGST